MDKLVKRRTALKGRITHLKNSVDSHATAPLSITSVETSLRRVGGLKMENDNLYQAIVELCADEAEIRTHEAPYTAEEERLYDCEVALNDIQKSHTPPTSSTSSAAGSAHGGSGSGSHSGAGINDVRLPKLELPSFSGSLQDWMSFHDLFKASVHNNTKLSGAQKLQYLKAAVKGEPASLIQALQITDVNYDEAWKTLKLRYQDKRELINHQFDRLFSIPGITSENPGSLQKMSDRARECTRSIEILGVSREDAYDLIVTHLLMKKLDPESRLQWERMLTKGQLPSLDDFCDFMDHQARVTGNVKASSMKSRQPQENRKQAAVHHGVVDAVPSKRSCVQCSKNHPLWQCEEFEKLSHDDRWRTVMAKRLCHICLNVGHRKDQCKSQRSCQHCKKPHHTLLHKERQKDVQPPSTPSTSTPVVNYHSTNVNAYRSKGLLSTALMRVRDSTGEFQICRALLDQGAETSFMTTSCATRLGIRRRRVDVPLGGLADSSAGTCKTMGTIEFSSCHAVQPSFQIDCLLMKTLTRDLPSSSMTKRNWKHLQDLELADPFYCESRKIDILLGSDIVYDLFQSGIRKGPLGSPVAIKTALGWILGGKLLNEKPTPAVLNHFVKCDLDATLKRFWELEEIPQTKLLTAEERACEDHFAQSHTRDDSGRYTVRLPFKSDCNPIGESRNMAVKRLKSVERRHAADPTLKNEYHQVINEYLDLKHMELVPEDCLQSTTKYYMPHHAVIKECSSTTKLRVVFDASAVSSSGVSLNQNLLIGPKLQDDLVTLLIRFRKHKVAFTADIAKMYRQIKMDDKDVDFQRIVWRTSPTEPIRDYRLTTVTFGVSAAPYLAIKSIQQLAEDEGTVYPEAAAIVRKDFYVDDLMSGATTEEDGLQLQKQLIELLSLGKLELRKWSSNSPALLSALPENMRETKFPLSIDEDESVKTLGLKWHPATDLFCFKVVLCSETGITKRKILSEIAKVFDPLGWLSPVTITAKILMQQMWKEEFGWDEPLSPELQEKWMDYRLQLPMIEDVRIPRYICQEQSVRIELHGFCDASEIAYGAVIFIRTINASEDVTVHMIAAKSKVAPIKQVTIPRLELCGAVLLVRLLKCVQNSLDLPVDDIFGWTDSTIVLSWLASSPHRWKTFVANRVSEIQDVIPRSNWNHVKTDENPADCASRGIPASSLSEHLLWWKGPSWLSLLELPTSADSIQPMDNFPLSEERVAIKIFQVHCKDSMLYRFSKLSRLLRVTVYCQRFISNIRKKQKRESIDKLGPLSADEIHTALHFWIKTVQHEEFSEDISALRKSKDVPSRSKLKQLNPFIDDACVLRVGGRLKNAALSPDAKHQILLPKKHHLTTLIVDDQHIKSLHAGPQALLAELQQNYWILSGRDVVRHFIHGCVICCRFRAQCAQQQMGNLPSHRITPAPPFQRCGVDYAGPYSLTLRSGRGQRAYKSYVALFICLVSRAIHLELVSDMTTDTFLAALKRFIARRGKPTDIYSDCGSNFVGAKRNLEDHLKLVMSEPHNVAVQDVLASESIRWHLNPPSAPHFGGLWEAGVKSMKFHLHRVIGTTTLTTEEMGTLLAQVEACLNSKPITELSSDPADLLPLTPGHFLIGRPLTAVAEPGLLHLKEGHLSRWQRVQQLYQHFWKRWSMEYLNRLQQRNKWFPKSDNLTIGRIVLIKDDNLPPAQWKLGRILATFPGKDGLTRVVSVKTATGELQRPVAKLCVLPPLDDS